MQQRSEETRVKIITAAMDLFAKQGYDATGVAEICAAAGVSKGAFYHHFETKQAVFLVLLEDWLKALESQLQAAQDIAASVPEGLTGMAELAGGVFLAAKEKFPLFLEFWVQASRQPEVWMAAISPYYHYKEFFVRIVERGIQEGTLAPNLNPESTARIVMGMAMGLLLQAFFDSSGANWEKVTSDGMAMLITGLEKRD